MSANTLNVLVDSHKDYTLVHLVYGDKTNAALEKQILDSVSAAGIKTSPLSTAERVEEKAARHQFSIRDQSLCYLQHRRPSDSVPPHGHSISFYTSGSNHAHHAAQALAQLTHDGFVLSPPLQSLLAGSLATLPNNQRKQWVTQAPDASLMISIPPEHPFAALRAKKPSSPTPTAPPSESTKICERILAVAAEKHFALPKSATIHQTHPYYTGYTVEDLRVFIDGKKRMINKSQADTLVRLMGYSGIDGFCQNEFGKGFSQMVKKASASDRTPL